MTHAMPAKLDNAIFNALYPSSGDIAFRLTDQVWRAVLAAGRVVEDHDHPGRTTLVISLEDES